MPSTTQSRTLLTNLYTSFCLITSILLFLAPNLQLPIANYQAKALLPNLTVIQTALNQYETATGHLPNAATWTTDILPYLPHQTPAILKGWAMNQRLSLTRGNPNPDGTDPNKPFLKSSELPKTAIILVPSNTETTVNPNRDGTLPQPFPQYQTKIGTFAFWKGSYAVYLTKEGIKLLSLADARAQLRLRLSNDTSYTLPKQEPSQASQASSTPRKKLLPLSEDPNITKHPDYYELKTTGAIIYDKPIEAPTDLVLQFQALSNSPTPLTTTVHFQNQFKQPINCKPPTFTTTLTEPLLPGGILRTAEPIPEHIKIIGFNPTLESAQTLSGFTRKPNGSIELNTPINAPKPSFTENTVISEIVPTTITTTHQLQTSNWETITVPILKRSIPFTTHHLTVTISIHPGTFITEPILTPNTQH